MNLSPRQHEVLTAIWDGETQKEIAGRLGITRWSVDTHMLKLRKKFGARNNVELCRKALKMGMLKL